MPHRDRKKKPIRFRSRGASPLTAGFDDNRELLVRLVEELQQVGMESMEALGVSRKEQMAAYRRAIKGVAPSERPSTSC